MALAEHQDMNVVRSMENQENPEMRAIRDALGAVPAGRPAVFWLYADYLGRWCVRQEGELDEHQFPNRAAARTFMQVEAARCSSYHLFIARSDGRFIEEFFNWPTPQRHHHK
jgi:hypothetical protein